MYIYGKEDNQMRICHGGPRRIRDGFGRTTDIVRDTINALAECGMPEANARKLVADHGPEGALSAAKNPKYWSPK